MKLRYLSMLAICALFTACSDTPSDSRIASQIAGQFNREFGIGFMQIDHLKRTQGHRDGHGRYVADVEYDLKFTQGLNQAKQEIGSAQAMELHVIFGDFRAGDTRHFANRVIFAKNAKGWVLIDSRRKD